MTDDNFWKSIKRACEDLDVAETTFRVWKSRGRIPESKVAFIFQKLQNTPHEISLERLIEATK